MAWGGGTITGGAPMGGAVGGSPGNPGNGLPFAGIPWEMRQGVEKLLADEPDLTGDPRWQASESTFTHRMKETGISLRRMLRPHRRMMTLSAFFILVEALCVQAGPVPQPEGHRRRHHAARLDRAGDHRHRSRSSRSSCRRWRAVRASPPPGASRRSVMFELRVRTFAHLQRLSLDYYTDEKAGVIMTRMTSDIESLQQLLQDGLPQFALQGLTMVIVTVVLFFYNVELALITLLLIVPDPHRAVAVVPRRRPTRATTACATASPACSATSPRACRACAWSPASTGPATTCCSTATSPATTATPTTTPRSIAATYGAGTEFVGLLGQAALLLIGGNMVRDGNALRRRARRVHPLPQLVLPARSSRWCSSTTCTSRARPRSPSSTSCSRRTRPSRRRRTRRRSRRSRARSRSKHVSFAYDPAKPVLHDVDLDIAAGRDDLAGRPDRRGQVDHRQARHPLLRPDRGQRRDRRPRPARRHHRLAAPPARRRAPGAVPVRGHHARQHRVRPARRRPTTR